MENNSYYTPTIEEFHVGFEYEEFGNMNNWFKTQFGDSNSAEYNNELSECYWNIDHNKIRVKHLDQSDIESLGFVEDKSNSEPDRLNLEFIKDGYTYSIVLYDTTQIVIYKYKYKEEILFTGTIKNKSELIKLMQQLNIK